MIERAYIYKLIGKLAVPCADLIEWAKWFKTANRRVAVTDVGPMRVSTVFLGLDYNFNSLGDPLLFETMIFTDETWAEDYQKRCSTWEQAERMHDAAVSWARARLDAANAMLESRASRS